MNEKRASLEIIAPTVDEALAKGLSDLGLREDEVEVEILDEGSRGLFGLGARQARVRLTVKQPPAGRQVEVAPAPPVETVSMQQQGQYQPVPAAPPAPAVEPGEEDEILRVAHETVAELLDKMKVRANVTAQFGEADEGHTRIPILINVSGNDLSILIGRQAETLNALQYISSLIIGKELGRSVPVIIDVEGYRQRREQQIRQLARRMADQAIKTGRRQILEPMPANERRLIHLELRDNPQVTTESTGEEPRRKVTIIPK
jgi:spoIIIJ-associated protein